MDRVRYRLGYVPKLDGLRGIAILLVMAHHTEIPFLHGGFIGVDIFFVLSGFLISALLIQEFDTFQSIRLKNFYVRRLLRLVPALIAMLLMFCLLSFIFLSKDMAYRNFINSMISLFYMTNWAEAFSIHPPSFLAHTWSLSIEEQFYIIWPIVLFALLKIAKYRYHIAIFASTVAALSWIWRIFLCASGTELGRMFYGLDTRIDALAIGCALGIAIASELISDRVKAMLSKSLVVIAPLSVVTLFGLAAFSNGYAPIMFYIGFTAVEILTVFLILDIFLNPKSIIGKALSIPWLVWIGTISYGLYLWHFPIYQAMIQLGYSKIFVLTIGSSIALIVSTISYYGLESPILKIKKRFTRTSPA